MLSRTRTRQSSRGFTIVELLIATSVFSLVLILVTTGVLRFSREYYKGVISGKTQDSARAIVDDITRSIQFNGGGVSNLASPGGMCVGQSKRYRFYTNVQVTDGTSLGAHQARHALVSDTVSGCSSSTPAPDVRFSSNLPGTNPRELLGAHMRLAKFSVTGANNLWTINVRVVYGDDAYLCSPSIPGNCNPTATAYPSIINDLSCRNLNGSQFCAVSELTTTIDKRVSRVH